MPFAAAISEHPDGAEACAEVVGEILETIGSQPELATLFLTAPHTAAVEDMTQAVQDALAPTVLLGAAAVSVIGRDREIEERPAVSLWAGHFGARATPVRLDTVTTADGMVIVGMPPVPDDSSQAMILIPDPFSFPADVFIDGLATEHPDLRILGGLASAAGAPGGNRLILDGEVFRDGAVGVLIDPGEVLTTVVSQGCRPIGRPYTVTAAEGNTIFELGGEPALKRLQELVGSLDNHERTLVSHGLHLGRVIDESKLDFERGDFLIRGVLGGDDTDGSLVVGDRIEVGTAVQFQVRDGLTAGEDLNELLAGQPAGGALVFTCNGRGTHMFDTPSHDARAVTDHSGTMATGGMFCAGEIGPVGTRNFLHGFTASVGLFRD